jgi:hypothetical protein
VTESFALPPFQGEVAMGGHLDNQLLALLDHATFASVEPQLAVVQLALGDVIAETHARVRSRTHLR